MVCCSRCSSKQTQPSSELEPCEVAGGAYILVLVLVLVSNPMCVHVRIPFVHAVIKSGGSPSGAAVDGAGSLFIAEMGLKSITTMANGEVKTVCASYEQDALLGPHSVVLNSKGSVYFTDSGPMGETGLHVSVPQQPPTLLGTPPFLHFERVEMCGLSSSQNPRGSVYAVVKGLAGTHLKPIAYSSLASPAGLALSTDERDVFVCELMANRLVRIHQHPVGVYHMSVFHQFSGAIGPVGVAVARDGTIFVAVTDTPGEGKLGFVHVLSPNGQHVASVDFPTPQLSGIALSPDETTMLVTSGARGGEVYSASVPQY